MCICCCDVSCQGYLLNAAATKLHEVRSHLKEALLTHPEDRSAKQVSLSLSLSLSRCVCVCVSQRSLHHIASCLRFLSFSLPLFLSFSLSLSLSFSLSLLI